MKAEDLRRALNYLDPERPPRTEDGLKAVAEEYDMRTALQIRATLAGLMSDLGEEQFTAAWREAFEGQEPPLDALRQARKRGEGQ